MNLTYRGGFACGAGTHSVIGESGADAVESRSESGADHCDGADDHRRDERRDQAVFDGGRAGLVPKE